MSSNIKTIVEVHVSSENVTIPTFCWSMIATEVARYLPSANKIVSTNQHAN